MAGFANYGNPFQILLHRLFGHDGDMMIVDRMTGISVKATCRSYHMFGETWYQRDYDVAGCALRKDDLVIDIGANHGFFTCYAAQRGARVYAFEPNPRTFEFLNKNVIHNGFADQVQTQCVAVADFESEADLFCSTYLGGGTDTINRKHADAVTSLGQSMGRVSVRAARLDSLIPSDLKVRLLKIDCEGMELAILKDLKNIDRFDAMAIEVHPHAYPIDALIKTILDFGTHQVYALRRYIVYALRRYIVHAIRTDVLLAFAKGLDLSL